MLNAKQPDAVDRAGMTAFRGILSLQPARQLIVRARRHTLANAASHCVVGNGVKCAEQDSDHEQLLCEERVLRQRRRALTEVLHGNARLLAGLKLSGTGQDMCISSEPAWVRTDPESDRPFDGGSGWPRPVVHWPRRRSSRSISQTYRGNEHQNDC